MRFQWFFFFGFLAFVSVQNRAQAQDATSCPHGHAGHHHHLLAGDLALNVGIDTVSVGTEIEVRPDEHSPIWFGLLATAFVTFLGEGYAEEIGVEGSLVVHLRAHPLDAALFATINWEAGPDTLEFLSLALQITTSDRISFVTIPSVEVFMPELGLAENFDEVRVDLPAGLNFCLASSQAADDPTCHVRVFAMLQLTLLDVVPHDSDHWELGMVHGHTWLFGPRFVINFHDPVEL